MDHVGKRGRVAVSAGLAAGALAALPFGEQALRDGPISFASLAWFEAAICGVVAGALTGPLFGRPGLSGLGLALLGGVAATLVALALFAAGGSVWAEPGARLFGSTGLAEALALAIPFGLALGLALHGLEAGALRLARLFA